MEKPKLPSKKTLPERLCGISMWILFVFLLLIGLFLVFYSVRYSYYSPTNYALPVQLMKDNPLLNILVFIAAAILSVVLNHLFERCGDRQRKMGYLFLAVCCILYAAGAVFWILSLPYYPEGDQLIVTAAAYYHRKGNFSMLTETGYLGKFPYQKGLALIYEGIFSIFGDFSYTQAAILHVLLGVITMITGYLFIEETSRHSICKIMYCPLFLFCVPYLILTPYTYGDLPSICFGSILFLALLRFARTGRWRYVVISCIVSALSLMVRVPTWIVFIALFIGLALVSMQKKRFAPILASVVIIACSFCTIKAIDYSYYLRSGYPVTQGAPMILTLAMGMQNNENGPGTYNDYQTTTMGSVDFDRKAAARIAREDLKDNLSDFIRDPLYAKSFFKKKLMMQWTEPTFEALMSTHSFDEAKPVPEWIQKIYFGSWHDSLIRFADRYQAIVYLGFFCFLPVFLRRRKENAACYIPLITIVGGFLFSIIWESQCRYVLPYYMFMLLYVPDGIYFAGARLKHGFGTIYKIIRRP